MNIFNDFLTLSANRKISETVSLKNLSLYFLINY